MKQIHAPNRRPNKPVIINNYKKKKKKSSKNKWGFSFLDHGLWQLLQMQIEKKRKLELKLVSFRETKVPFFHTRTFHWSGPIDGRSSFSPLKTLSNDSTCSTLEPLCHCENSLHGTHVLPTCSHPSLLFSPVSASAGRTDCCSI